MDKQVIKRLWDSGYSISTIVRMIPRKPKEAHKLIAEMRESGEIEGRSGKSAEKTSRRVLSLYQKGITSPYEIADNLNLSPKTVKRILCELKLNRKRPHKNYNQMKLCDKTHELLMEMRSGATIKELSVKNNVSTQYLYKIKAKYITKGE